ncbi:MAG: SWIM zinc finger domain-containing protein [Saprospiraceae bacterium]
MNFPLQNIEAHLDEESLLHGEQLLQEGKVSELLEAEKHLWLAQVEDNRLLEVEVKISPSKVLAASCECERFRQEKMCGHISAVLLKLRQERSEKIPPKAPPVERSEEPAPRRLTTGVVLEQVSHEDLVAFVRQYAKTNRNFAIALKARFAPDVSDIDSKEKYLQLLDTTISSARRPDRTFNQRGANSIYKVLLEIEQQMEDAIVQRHLVEAVVMAQSVIEKVTPLLRKTQYLQEELRQQVRHAFDTLRQVLNLLPPPTLREAIWEYGFTEGSKIIYRSNQVDQYFFRLLLSMSDESSKTEQLLELLEEQITRYYFEKRDIAPVLLQKLTLLEKLDRTEELQAFIQRYITNEEILHFAVKQAMQRQDFKHAKILAQSALANGVSKNITAEMEDTLLQIAEAEEDWENVRLYAGLRLLATLNAQYYITLKRILHQNWKELYPSLLHSIKQLPYSPGKQRLIAAIYQEEGLYPELAQHLEQAKSLDLAREFGLYLVEYDINIAFQLYNDLFFHYLKNHVGRKPSEKIRTIIHQLYEKNYDELAERLIENLRTEFPERHSLMEELELL